MNLTVDRSLLNRKPVENGEIISESTSRNSAVSDTQKKPRQLSPPATTRPATNKGSASNSKRLRSPDIRNDEDDAQTTRKKPKLKRIDNDGKPVRRDDDGVTSTSNAGPLKKDPHRSKRDKADKKAPDVDMDFFSGPSKATEVIKRKEAGPAAVISRDGGVTNVSRKSADGPLVKALEKPRTSDKLPTVAESMVAPRPPAADGLFIKKRKVS